MTRYGYARVSTLNQEQNNGCDRQVEALLNAGISKENIYCDTFTGAKSSRPQFNKLRETLKPGDEIVVSELSRLSRSTKQTLELIEEFEANNIIFTSLKESLSTNSPMARCFLTCVSAFNQLERELINERCQEGRELAKKQGRMGRKRVSDTRKEELEHALLLFEQNQKSVKQITEITGISSASIYREAKARNITRK